MSNTFGVIDIGSLKVKFLLASIDSNNNYTELYSSSVLTCLGCERVNNGGAIVENNVNKTYVEVARCMEILHQFSVKNYRVVATQALREATNSDEVIQRIINIIHKEVETITAEEEALMFFKAVMIDMPDDLKTHLVVDMGGGSVQLIFGNKHEIKDMALLPTGAQHLHDVFVKDAQNENSKTDPEELRILRKFIQSELQNTPIDHQKYQNIPIIYGSSNIQDLFQHIQLPLEYNGPSKTHAVTTHPSHLEEFIQRMIPLTFAQREAQFSFQKGYMWGIDKAFSNIIAFAETFSSTRIIPSNANVAKGILYDLALMN